MNLAPVLVLVVQARTKKSKASNLGRILNRWVRRRIVDHYSNLTSSRVRCRRVAAAVAAAPNKPSTRNQKLFLHSFEQEKEEQKWLHFNLIKFSIFGPIHFFQRLTKISESGKVEVVGWVRTLSRVQGNGGRCAWHRVQLGFRATHTTQPTLVVDFEANYNFLTFEIVFHPSWNSIKIIDLSNVLSQSITWSKRIPFLQKSLKFSRSKH